MQGEERDIKDKMAVHLEELMSACDLYDWEKV